MHAVTPGITRSVPVGGPCGDIDRERVQTTVSFGFALTRWHFDCPQPELAPQVSYRFFTRPAVGRGTCQGRRVRLVRDSSRARPA
jgi:hypothetical protein